MGGARRITGRALLPDGSLAPATLTFEGSTLVDVRPAAAGEPVQDGLLVPGLVNAHTHFELSHLGLVPSEGDLPTWIRAQFARRGERGEDGEACEARIAARAAAHAGTALVCDIAGGPSTAGVLRDAGLVGIVQRERLGQDSARTRTGTREAPGLHQVSDAVIERPAAHAPYSTHPELAAAALAPSEVTAPVPGAVHLAEDAAERRFLREGAGPFAALLDDVGVRWSFAGPCEGPIDWLRTIGALGPGTLAVHGVDLTADERQALADSRTPLVLCVRSNLHISGRAPDVVDLLDRGVRLALGTDGLVSCPDQDVLAEVPALARLAPEVPVSRWLTLATRDGADALGIASHGAFRPGTTPGVLHLDTDEAGLRTRAPMRRWIVPPGRVLRRASTGGPS